VAVVCVNGFKALKEKYGNQVLGVYLKCDKDIAIERAEKRDSNKEIIESRLKKDDDLIKEIESVADVTIDGNQDLNKVLADILKTLRERRSI
jgi:dephospho-CoA kinase